MARRVGARCEGALAALILTALPLAGQSPDVRWEMRSSAFADLWFSGLAQIGVVAPGAWPFYDRTTPGAPAPAVVRHHVTVGLGWRTGGVGIDAGYYRALENEVSGPIWGPTGPIPGSDVTSALTEDSFLLQLTWTPES